MRPQASAARRSGARLRAGNLLAAFFRPSSQRQTTVMHFLDELHSV
jgi:hypothetical protein